MGSKERFLELVERTSKEGGQCSNWREQAEWRRENRGWLLISGKIAVAILTAIDETPGMSKELLAKKTGLDINKIVKGSVDLTVGEIKILEDALGVVLIGKERRS
jgi:ribosome-binding protein aMBF1 (putative translation factor)